VNVTSGGAFVAQVFAPIYSACKAALHSDTMTLRHALQGTVLRVVELVPPAVRTGLASPGSTHGASLDEFCNPAFERLQRGDSDVIGFGPIDTPEFGQMLAIGEPFFAASAARFPVVKLFGEPVNTSVRSRLQLVFNLRVHVLYKRPEIPANKVFPAIALSVT
jgi:uncharacterized oxidoreductase